ncbi:right-handed parallel beta-helix repeat-containing protein [Mucilaginibacter gynuensis]|uniref:Right-handed parallel beta-helix repeat-containing protein n=1 Tax=Mucilaginibacter gynuensis TaxID=1302236 RepID=A0ABP8GDY1_9SPHI
MQKIIARLKICVPLLLLCFGTCTLFAQTKTGKHFSNTKGVTKGKTWFVNPQTGDDKNTGTGKQQAWKTFVPVNRLQLSAGDVVEVLAGGEFRQSLVIKGKGNKQAPVTVKLAPGRYDIFPDDAVKKQLHISNTNDKPYEPKAIALFFDNCRYVQVQGTGANIVLHGKMLETLVDHCDNISITGLSFDYNRPTVSELQVTNVGDGYADVTIHPDSKFSIKDSLITWIGDGWSYQPDGYWQVLNPQSNDLQRMDMPMKELRFVAGGGRNARIYFKNNPGFAKGNIYQNRDVTRDCAGVFMRYSSNIKLNNIRIYFMHGMGVVSQYCRNINMDKVVVKPAENSGRTCAAWADILHFSGCSGKIEVANSYLSAANDDAVNVHGTHLKITKILAPNQVQVKFMHGQTFGFEAFAAKDSVSFINPESLLIVEDNVVAVAKQLNDKEFLLTFKKPLLGKVKDGLVVENTTATPQVWIHHTTVTRIPTRGVLTTTRRKVLIEHNTFEQTHMSPIFISDDASSWFESGMVTNVTISHNNFNLCGGPVIFIHPENTVNGPEPVHAYINVTNNTFQLKDKELFAAKSTTHITIANNTIKVANAVDISDLLKLVDCSNVAISGNKLINK